MSVFKETTTTFKDETLKVKKEKKPLTTEQKLKRAEYMKRYWHEHPDKYKKNLTLINERNRRRREELKIDAKKSE